MKIQIENADVCYVCGSEQLKHSYSLHIWEIKYKCGCVIWGPLSSKEIELLMECPKEKTMKPLYQHDCSERCIFLGNDGEKDYYFHRDPDHVVGSTLICRYSSDGWDYSSGEDFCMCVPGLNKALELGFAQHIFTQQEYDYLKRVQTRALEYFEIDPEYKKSIDKRWEGLTRFVLP